jgi:hypothetical protein
MENRWVRTAVAWVAFLVAGFIAWQVTDWAVSATFWAIAAHYAVALVLDRDGDPLGRRLALLAVVSAVGIGTLAVTTARWGSHEWPAVMFALFLGWLTHEIAGRLLTPKLIRGRLDRLRGNVSAERYA